jgi:hypothetical protein
MPTSLLPNGTDDPETSFADYRRSNPNWTCSGPARILFGQPIAEADDL